MQGPNQIAFWGDDAIFDRFRRRRRTQEAIHVSVDVGFPTAWTDAVADVRKTHKAQAFRAAVGPRMCGPAFALYRAKGT